MMSLLLFLFLYVCSANGINSTGNIRVVLTGLFAYNVTDIIITPNRDRVANGLVVESAVRFAIEEINANISQLSLSLWPVSTECDPARAAWSVSDTLDRTLASEPVVILGPPCEDSATHLVRMISRFTNIITVSYAATTPQINDATIYRNFFRTVAPFTDLNEALRYLLISFSWKNVCLVLESEPYYNTAAEDLPRNLTIIEAISQSNLQYITSRTYCRIFIIIAEPKYIPNIFCQAIENDLTGELFQWIILGNVEPDDLLVTDQNCTQQDLTRSTESVLIVSFYETSELSLKRQIFEKRLQSLLTNTTISRHDMKTAASAYDATWAIALALDASMTTFTENPLGQSLQDYLPLENRDVAETIIRSFESLDFNGISTTVQFTSSRHSTQSAMKISQVQGHTIIPIGLYKHNTLNMTYFRNELQWIGERGPPRDSPISNKDDVPVWTQILMLVISVLGCVLLVCFAAINCHFRENKVIKASSPHVNTLILAGCLMGFISVITYTIAADNRISNYVRSFSCNAAVWSVNIMFTLSFGALLAKTWRVCAVFRNPWTKRRIYKDYMLFVIVMAMLMVDLVIMLVWTIVSPIEIIKRTLDTPSAITELSYCNLTSLGVYFGTSLVTYKCFLLILGCYLATQTRHIKAKFFNDTKYIAVAIYGVVLMSIIGFPIGIFMLSGLYIFISYICITLTIIGISLLVSCVVFLPKFILLYKTRKNDSMDMLSTSTKVESRSLGERKASLASLVLNDYRRNSQDNILFRSPLDYESNGATSNVDTLPTIKEVENDKHTDSNDASSMKEGSVYEDRNGTCSMYMYKGLHRDCV